ncbi:flavodoxin reductase, partial [Aquimarina sp. U1-2]
MSGFHKLSIKNITRVTDKAVSIGFNVPENLKGQFQFKAGQYITLKTQIDGNDIRRDYSLCVSPHSGNLKVA